MLDVILKTDDGNQVVLNKIPFTIGNLDAVCDYVINNPDVSAIHCMIEEDGNNLVIKEMNTKLGVDVSGRHLEGGQSVILKSGDEIKIGDNTFTFISDLELFNKGEAEQLNAGFKDIQNETDLDLKKKKAASIIGNLYEKIKLINGLINENGQNVSMSQAAKTYLSPVFGEDFKLQEKTESINHQENLTNTIKQEEVVQEVTETPKETISEAKPERATENIEQVKEALRGKNSFEIRRHRRTLDQAETSNPTSSHINDRKVNVQFSKLGRPGLNKAQSHQTKATRQVDHPILKEQEKSITLREIEPPYNVIKITKTPFKIGRSSNTNDYILDRKGISRNHATIMRDDRNRNYVLRDNNATNGTYLNDSRIINNEVIINKGDTVKFYEYEFKVVDIKE